MTDEKENKKEKEKKGKRLELEVDEVIENKLLDRKEVSFTVSHPGLSVPSKKEVSDLLVKSLKLSKDDAVTISIASRFGSNRSRGRAKIYSNKESMIKIEGGGDEQ